MLTFRRRYGAGALHLLAYLASFALAGAAAWSLLHDRTVAVVIWFVAAAVLHDLLFLPLYALADRGLVRGLPRRAVNHVRIPAAVSLLLLVVYFPEIARLSDVYTATTGLSSDHYFVRWLTVSGVAFLLSAIHFAARGRRVP